MFYSSKSSSWPMMVDDDALAPNFEIREEGEHKNEWWSRMPRSTTTVFCVTVESDSPTQYVLEKMRRFRKDPFSFAVNSN